MKSIFYPDLKNVLEEKTGVAKYNGSRTELIIRCPFPDCSDNLNPVDHGHLYISVRDPFFNCFKCTISGSILKLLKFLKLDPKEYLLPEALNVDFLKHSYKRHDNFGVTLHKLQDPNKDKYKLKTHYLKSRLGFDYPIEKIPGLVFDIRNFVIENNIELDETQNKLLDYYESSFIGFVTSRGTKLMLRNIEPKGSIEHAKIDLNKDVGYFKDFYGFRTRPINKELNTIVLAEGVFDVLLGIEHYELFDLRNSSCFWSAVLSNYYDKTIISVLDICKLTKAKVVILSDKDKSLEDYKWLSWNPSIDSVDIYYNKLGHDFGKLPISIVKAESYNRDKKWRY